MEAALQPVNAPDLFGNPSDPRKNAGGRPTKFNPDTADKVLKAIRAGAYVETAAAFAGLNKSTLYDWLKRGQRAKAGKLKEFSNAVSMAMAESEVRDVNAITKAVQDGDWKAAAWRLERKHPKRWGKKEEHTLKGDPKAPIMTGLAVRVIPSNVVDAKTGRALQDGQEVEDAVLVAPAAAPVVAAAAAGVIGGGE